jgi:signal recognition particle receptor subunit beta
MQSLSEHGAFAILLTLTIVPFLALLLFLFFRRQVRIHILMAGVSDAGKTTLFTQLILPEGSCLKTKTCTSIHENVADLITPKHRAFKLVDLPGHEKVRQQTLNRYKGLARGIVFVVDSGNIQSNVRDVAEFLYNMMTDPVLARSHIPMLIVCNKQDMSTAKGQAVIRAMLEKEFNILRQTKAGQLTYLESKRSQRPVQLGKEGEPFNFDGYRGMKVTFSESVCMKEDNNNREEDKLDISGIHDWLDIV